ncbi:MAG: inorganic diphosphatase [Candidatus Paceibacterota bacterium]
MNYWHDLEPGTADEMTTIVEIPKGSKNKYEIDKETGLIALDRAMHTAQDYPFDYGYIPQTLWDDDDALDVIILTSNPLDSGILVRTRPVGIMNMIDDGERDDKIIAVPTTDPRFDEILDLTDVNSHTLKEMNHFYATYKNLQDKEVEVTGFGDKKAAIEAFERGKKLYNEAYKN